MVDLGLLRTATLLPHALVRPIALLTALILATLAVLLAFLLVKGVPYRAAHRADSIASAESLKRAESLKVEARATPPIEESPKRSPIPVVTLKEVFDYQLADYKARLDQLDANVKLQALFFVFTILLVLRRSDSLNLFGNQLPLQWLHLFVPVVMIYLWLNFGFILDALIYGRLWGVEILKAHSPATAEQGKLLFQDSGFVDGWFLSFVDKQDLALGDYSGIDHNSRTSTATLLILVFGTLLSAAHACIIGMTFIGCRRYLRRLSRRFLLLYYLLPLIPVAVLIVSHLQFAYGGSNRNSIQLYIAFMTIPLVAILLWVSVIVDRTVDPASVQCLRRQRRLVHAGPRFPAIHHKDSIEAFTTMSLIGDSLSTRFYVGSLPGMLLRMWRAWKGTWFAAAQGDKLEIRSIFERLFELTPISAAVHASARAKVDANGNRTLVDLLTNTRHLSNQVDEVLLGEFPDLLLLWIGHNNLDWHSRVKELTHSRVEELTAEWCEELATEFTNSYRKQLRRLLKGALRSKKRIVLVVYGLINFESFFQARTEAERLRNADSTQYPYLEKDYDYFSSMKPEHRNGMVRLSQVCNEKLEEVCRALDEEIRRSDIRLVYSDALSRAEISGANMLNESDAWHPSSAGHKVLAKSAYEPIKEELSYLDTARE